MNRDETTSDAGEPEFRFRKKRKVWVKKSDGLKGVRAGPLDLRVRRIRGHQNYSLPLRRTAKSAREALLQQFEDCMEFSPRNTDLPVVTAAIRASLRDNADKPGGTTARGRKDGARERDEPSSSRADRKRSGRR